MRVYVHLSVSVIACVCVYVCMCVCVSMCVCVHLVVSHRRTCCRRGRRCRVSTPHVGFAGAHILRLHSLHAAMLCNLPYVSAPHVCMEQAAHSHSIIIF